MYGYPTLLHKRIIIELFDPIQKGFAKIKSYTEIELRCAKFICKIVFTEL